MLRTERDQHHQQSARRVLRVAQASPLTSNMIRTKPTIEKVPHSLTRGGEDETRKTRDKLKENSQTRRYIKRHTSNFKGRCERVRNRAVAG